MGLHLDLWIWTLDAHEPNAPTVSLSEDEEARAARFVHTVHRRRFRSARVGLRKRLALYTGCAAVDLQFLYGPQGRPSLADGPSFNLSHSDDVAALVVAPESRPDLALGVDIERHRQIEPGVARRFFSKGEQTALDALPAEERDAAFFRCWTRKEAVIKAHGKGLWMPLNSFDVTLDPSIPPRVTRLVNGDPTCWSLHAFDVAPDLPGAIAVKAAGQTIICARRQLHTTDASWS